MKERVTGILSESEVPREASTDIAGNSGKPSGFLKSIMVGLACGKAIVHRGP